VYLDTIAWCNIYRVQACFYPMLSHEAVYLPDAMESLTGCCCWWPTKGSGRALLTASFPKPSAEWRSRRRKLISSKVWDVCPAPGRKGARPSCVARGWVGAVPAPQVVLHCNRQITLNTKNVNHDKWEQISAMVVHVAFDARINSLMEI